MTLEEELAAYEVSSISSLEDELAAYEVMPSKENWKELISKSLASGAISLADVPQIVASYNPVDLQDPELYEAYSDSPSANFVTGELMPMPEDVYASSLIKGGINNITGIDLEPKPKTKKGRIVSKGGEFVGALVGGNLLGATKKGKEAVSLLNRLRKGTGTAALMGSAQQGLEELGVNPLVASAGSMVLAPTATSLGKGIWHAGKNTVTLPFGGGNKRLNQRVGNYLRDNITDKEAAFKNLDTYQAPFDTSPVAAEVFQDPAFSNLHRAFAPNMGAVEMQIAENNALLRNELNKIGNNKNISSDVFASNLRDQMENKLAFLKKQRQRIAKPLYNELEKSQDLIPVTNFDKYNQDAIFSSIGRDEKILKEMANILPDKYNNNYLNRYLPQHVDQTISAIGDRIHSMDSLASLEKKNASLRRKLSIQKQKLTEDLEKHPVSSKHRKVYREASLPISEITKDPMFDKILRQSDYSYKLPENNVLDSILNADLKSSKNLKKQIKGSRVENELKAIIRDKYLNKALDLENEIPTYDKSSQFLNKYKSKLPYLLSPQETSIISDVNDVLKRRSAIQKSRLNNNSATAEKTKALQDFEKQFGRETEGGIFASALGYAPIVGKQAEKLARRGIASSKNKAYQFLQDALVNPHIALDYINLPAYEGFWQKVKSPYNPYNLAIPFSTKIAD